MIVYYRNDDGSLSKLAAGEGWSVAEVRLSAIMHLRDEGLSARPIFVLIQGDKGNV